MTQPLPPAADRAQDRAYTRPVWVTGASGFIGQHLVARLSRQGPVIAFVRTPGGASLARHVLSGGVTPASVEQALALAGQPGAVFHLAGGATVGQSLADPIGDFEKSVGTTACLLRALAQHAPEAPMVMASSAAVYGAGHQGPIACTVPLNPYSPYGHHKAMAEQLAREAVAAHGLSVTSVRLFSIYGEGVRKQLLWEMCRRLQAGETPLQLGGDGTEVRDWCHVDDIVDLILAALPSTSGQFRAVNGGSGRGTSVREIATHVLAAWGGQASVTFNGQSRPGDPHTLIADTSCAPRGFAWTVPVALGLQRYVDWFRTHAQETAT